MGRGVSGVPFWEHPLEAADACRLSKILYYLVDNIYRYRLSALKEVVNEELLISVFGARTGGIVLNDGGTAPAFAKERERLGRAPEKHKAPQAPHAKGGPAP